MSAMVVINRELLNAIFESAKHAYPRETVLLLRGKIRKNKVEVKDLIIPPLAIHGRGFASFPEHMLPIDFSLIGSVHSHPSGVAKPSVKDLNRSFGKIIMIVAYPFIGIENVAVYNHAGEKIAFRLTD